MTSGIYISWPAIALVLLVVIVALIGYLVYHFVQTLRSVRQTLNEVHDFLHDSGDVMRNLKSITYKLDRQLDDTGVVTENLRKAMEEVAHTVSVLGRLTGRPMMGLMSLLAPIFWWRRRRRK